MKKLTQVSYKKLLKKIKETNQRNTESLSKRHLNQLAKYTYTALTTGKVGSFRYLIYDVLKPAIGYGDGMFLGLLDFNNMVVDLAGRVKNGK